MESSILVDIAQKQTIIIGDGDDSGVPADDHAHRGDPCDNEGKWFCVLHDGIIDNHSLKTSTCGASWDSQWSRDGAGIEVCVCGQVMFLYIVP